MPKQSAGLLVYRYVSGLYEVLLVHPGGPFFAKKDAGSWSIPKGEMEDGEDGLATAIREFREELGVDISGDFQPLTPVKQKSGKIVHAWAVNKDIDISGFVSNTFDLEWPPRSGKIRQFPEVDKAKWFDFNEAATRINPAQISFLEQVKGMRMN